MRTKKLGIMMLCLLFVAGSLYGCGSSSKEGAGAAGDVFGDQEHVAAFAADVVDSHNARMAKLGQLAGRLNPFRFGITLCHERAILYA